LIDDAGALADQPLPYPVRRLQLRSLRPGQRARTETILSRSSNVSSKLTLRTFRRYVAGENLPSTKCRTLITVADPSDVATARVAKPNDLDSQMGVHLRSISVELTKDSVTSIDIDARLPFVINEEKKRLQITQPNVFIPAFFRFCKTLTGGVPRRAVETSVCGPSRHFACAQQSGRYQVKADTKR
jgi:hypothetical protein